MSHKDAHNLLDMRREGADIPPHIVDRALELTGDKEPDLLAEIIAEAA